MTFYKHVWLERSNLKITQYMLLQGILSGGTEKSITQLAQEVDMDRSTIGRNLRVLSRDGFGRWPGSFPGSCFKGRAGQYF